MTASYLTLIEHFGGHLPALDELTAGHADIIVAAHQVLGAQAALAHRRQLLEAAIVAAWDERGADRADVIFVAGPAESYDQAQTMLSTASRRLHELICQQKQTATA